MDEKIIPEMVIPTSVCPHPELWSAYDDMATEIEVIHLLRALVVALKPKRILETGCYHGHATEQMMFGAIENGFGEIITCDVSHNEQEITRERTKQWPYVAIIGGRGTDVINVIAPPIDFAFLDSGPDEVRTEELKALYPKLSARAVVAIHDSGIHGFLREKYLPPVLRELGMQYIFFDTPRGMCLCRKKPEIYP